MEGPAMERSTAEIWNAVDEGKLRPTAIGGLRRRAERLNRHIYKTDPAAAQPARMRVHGLACVECPVS
jgi:hypothetical protein